MKKILLIILFILIFSFSVSAMTGSGIEVDPYIIYNATDLKNVENNYGAYYELANDIDLGGGNFEPIGYASGSGYTAFTGHFDGKGYKIYNGSIGSDGVDYSGDDYIGIFAYITGIIQNLGVDGVNVTGQYFIGGLVGRNNGNIIGCYTTGDVEGNEQIGGLVGRNVVTVQNCYATGNVSGVIVIGGLVGNNYNGSITDCYATGNVSGDDVIGGLVGGNRNGTDTDNFWDTDTSGTEISAMGTGKTTIQMKDIDTYTVEGHEWDIVAIGDYVDEDWWIDDGNDYPHLGWEDLPSISITFNSATISKWNTAEISKWNGIE